MSTEFKYSHLEVGQVVAVSPEGQSNAVRLYSVAKIGRRVVLKCAEDGSRMRVSIEALMRRGSNGLVIFKVEEPESLEANVQAIIANCRRDQKLPELPADCPGFDRNVLRPSDF